MKTPVIIPAYNEAERIGQTLRALDADTVEPFVVVNGEEGGAETAQAARRYTNNVFTRPEQGKLPAMQFALRTLHEYDRAFYENPVLMIDADTHPLQSKRWARVMGQAVLGGGPRSAAGMLFYGDGPMLDCAVRNVRRVIYSRQDQGTGSLRSAYGANMALNFAGDSEIIDRVQGLPHIWPSEDRYLFHLLGGEGERTGFTQLSNIGSAVITSARYMPPLLDVLKKTTEERIEQVHTHYRARKARGATHYFDEQTGQLVEYQEIDA